MTRTEAEALMLAAYPEQSVFIECGRRSTFFCADEPRGWQTSYVASVIPGLGGKTCSQWEGCSLEEVIRKSVEGRVPQDMADAFFHPPKLIRCDVCQVEYPPKQIGQSTADTVLCKGCLDRARASVDGAGTFAEA